MAGGITWDTSGFSDGLKAMVERIELATRTATEQGAAVVVKAAVLGFNGQHNKGTPRSVGGNRPQSISGNLKKSIHMLEPPTSIGPGVYQARVAPTMIYGRRIERGFHGQDSLGRRYDQNGFPYLSPAVDRAMPAIQALAMAAWAEALEG